MTTDNTPEPRSAVVLPNMGDIPRAGKPKEQIAFQDRAWTMLETYKTPSGIAGSRLSNAWLGEHGWRVQLAPHFLLGWSEGDAWVEPLARAARARGHRTLLGCAVEPGEWRASAVWRVPTTAEGIARFFSSHHAAFHMLVPQDLGFAVHANDGDYAVYAGPEAFVRAALPPGGIGPAATEAVKQAAEEEHGEGCLDGILAHYRDFMLD